MLSTTNRRLTSISMLCGASLTLVGALATTTAYADPAPAAPAAAPAAPKMVISGLIDGYYAFNTTANKLSTTSGGAYVVKNATPTIALAELNISQAPPTVGGFGYKATLTVGDTADINHASYLSPVTTREGRYKNIQQLYGTYLSASGYGVDFGKFYTPFGYEVTESNANFNYSRSTVYNILPFYHTGARFYTPSMKGFVLTGYIVNAFYNSANEGVSANEKTPKFIGQVLFTDPNGKYTFIENIGGGTDNPSGALKVKSFLSDTDFTYTISPSDTVGLNYDYLKTEPAGSAKTTTNGWAVYYKKQLNPKDAVALRYSGVQAKTDAFGQTPGFTVKPFDVTATYEMKTASNFLSRLEYRSDGSNVAAFADNSGNFTKKSQSTLIASEVFTF